jgi:2'-hydroxyisoflavone reductase
VQFIDVRDLAEFMVHVIETNRTGIFNVAGPRRPMTASEFYVEATRVINPSAKLTFVDDYDFLTANKIDEAIPWAMLKGNDDGMMSVRNDRAIAAGLGFRPLEVTLRDTLAWWPTVPETRRQKPRFTITPEIESKALAAWHARTPG